VALRKWAAGTDVSIATLIETFLDPGTLCGFHQSGAIGLRFVEAHGAWLRLLFLPTDPRQAFGRPEHDQHSAKDDERHREPVSSRPGRGGDQPLHGAAAIG